MPLSSARRKRAPRWEIAVAIREMRQAPGRTRDERGGDLPPRAALAPATDSWERPAAIRLRCGRTLHSHWRPSRPLRECRGGGHFVREWRPQEWLVLPWPRDFGQRGA